MTSQSTSNGQASWPVFLPILLTLTVLALAVGSAFVAERTADPLTAQVEGLSAWASNALGRLSTVLPMGFAFGAGMVSAVNPCGFAMLPAYLGLYLGARQDAQEAGSMTSAIPRALFVGAIVSLGFIVLFSVVGLAVSAGARSFFAYFPWVGLGLGAVLVAVGAWTLSGRALYANLAERAAARVSGAGDRGVRGYFAFGLAYGLASLSCTLPIFLSVVGSSLTLGSLPSVMLQFLLYSFGMGSVIIVLSLSIALFRASLVGRVRALLPWVQPLSALALLLAGAYIAYYWLTVGGLLNVVL